MSSVYALRSNTHFLPLQLLEGASYTDKELTHLVAVISDALVRMALLLPQNGSLVRTSKDQWESFFGGLPVDLMAEDDVEDDDDEPKAGGDGANGSVQPDDEDSTEGCLFVGVSLSLSFELTTALLLSFCSVTPNSEDRVGESSGGNVSGVCVCVCVYSFVSL